MPRHAANSSRAHRFIAVSLLILTAALIVPAPRVAAEPDPDTNGFRVRKADPKVLDSLAEFERYRDKAAWDKAFTALAETADAQSDDALADWRDRLLQAGLNPADVDLMLRTLSATALNRRHLTIIYRLDGADMDRLVPLEVLPAPRKITRVGLVVLINAGPSIPFEIDDLIKQLGDDTWSNREEASKALAKIGLAAKDILDQATHNSDPEIAWRAEQLLVNLQNPTAPP